eukprot:TRINITY_DN2686_c0_g1_i1.p1 TRINITY_DN2686_c0_g1~~TRINITY_DN2686_c0_g1_i1.p1  ORF type:complete len:364 (+),score=66.66 TRINITY_DN2686_c0_g1_i1:39-1094(+)
MHRVTRIASHITANPTAASLEPDVVRVCVTGAAGQIGYSLIPLILNGVTFGQRKVDLRLLDIAPSQNALECVEMELEDCAFPLLDAVTITTDPLVAFRDVNAVFLVGAFPRRKGMERKDLLAKNAAIFKAQGKALDSVADKNVKVLVVGNPANTNALVCMSCAPSIPRENFTAMTRLDQNRATAQISNKVGVHTTDVSRVIIWGNHSATQYPDHQFAIVNTTRGEKSVKSLVQDPRWFKETFVPTVQLRGKSVIEKRGLGSSLSAARAASEHMRDWWLGSEDRIVSMGVVSKGEYGFPKGIIVSLPVVCTGSARYRVVTDLNISAESRILIMKSCQELVDERETAFQLLGL